MPFTAAVAKDGAAGAAPRVLVADALSPRALEVFAARGIDVEQQTGLRPEELRRIIGAFDGLVVRSATRVTSSILSAAARLRAIGRAGIGVDNIDLAGATARGIVVMNTPFGNSITTAEHAIALLCALAREIPAASASTRAGKWEKSRFMGVELTGKTLGVVGCGNIGAIVVDRAIGLRMKVIAADPFLTPERARALGAEKVELDELFARADFITLHTPLTPQTRHLLDATTLARCKHGVRIVNCARGGLIDEPALVAALRSGQVAGAALDVYAEEPAYDNPLFALDNVVCTPHLGASTTEAQENVALQIAAQMSDFLLTGAVTHALNLPDIPAEEVPRLRPYARLAGQLGSFVGQVCPDGVQAIEVSCEGHAAELAQQPLTDALLTGLLAPSSTYVNPVNARLVARDRGIRVAETRREEAGDYAARIAVCATSGSQQVRLAGSLFSGKPRLIEADGVPLESELTARMLFVRNKDAPGFIGRLGTTLGEAGLNIANFNLGRARRGADAVCLVSLDEELPAAVLQAIQRLPGVVGLHVLHF